MNRSREVEAKVGLFVFLGVGLVMLTILLLGGGNTLFQHTISYHTVFPQIEGLVEGAVVKIAGVKVGQVSKIKLLNDSNRVEVTFGINGKFQEAVHEDSMVGIRTQGVLGDRYLVVLAGTAQSPLAKDGFELLSETPKDLKDYLSTADQVLERFKDSLNHMEGILEAFDRENRAEIFFRNMTGVSTNLNSGTKNVKQTVDHLNSILAKVDNGNGTLGAIINDPSLYDDLKALLGGANRNKVLKYFVKKSVEESREAAKEEQKKK